MSEKSTKYYMVSYCSVAENQKNCINATDDITLEKGFTRQCACAIQVQCIHNIVTAMLRATENKNNYGKGPEKFVIFLKDTYCIVL